MELDRVKYCLALIRPSDNRKHMKLSKQFPRYESEITLFLKNLKAQNPNIEKSQQEGRALLWDKEPLDLDTQERNQESRVKQQAYVYQNKA